MKALKKLTVLIVACVMALCFCLAGCGDEDENKKYDVTIKIKNNFGSTWVFTPDISELTYEFEYTGEEMNFYVDSYNLPKHPRWSDKWFSPDFSGPNVFSKTMTYKAPNEKRAPHHGPIKEKGDYTIIVEACATSDLWEFRTVYLSVKVI